MSIHPSAIIGDQVKLGNNVSVGPFTVIEGNVVIGDDTTIANSCTIVGNTTIGKNCRIYSHATIGTDPQDKKYKVGEETVYFEMGDNNTVREFVTLNSGTEAGGGITKIGHGNLIMAYVHIAHDCRIGNDCVFVNAATFGGHVEIADRVTVGGLAACHQFVRIGTLAMVGGCIKAVQDIPPYAMVDDHRAKVYGLNLLGLKRAGIASDNIRALKKAFKIIFFSELAFKTAFEKIKEDVPMTPEVEHLLAFFKSSTRGVCGGVLQSE